MPPDETKMSITIIDLSWNYDRPIGRLELHADGTLIGQITDREVVKAIAEGTITGYSLSPIAIRNPRQIDKGATEPPTIAYMNIK
jgi:hypothetical protein